MNGSAKMGKQTGKNIWQVAIRGGDYADARSFFPDTMIRPNCQFTNHLRSKTKRLAYAGYA
jgi:hypothetical protein